ncbi:MAG: glycosyltransferase involved in cell wall biosynthesis [Roseivirga sp.]|jgi:glycosyltransferase involved in cell wall biosynthesis
MSKPDRKVAILLKSNLKYDGRVLAEIDTLSLQYPKNDFRIILLPDGPLDSIVLPENVSIKIISINVRKSRFKRVLLPFTTFCYTLMCFFELVKFKPDVIHVHDIFPVPSGLLYSFFASVNIVYDDHELFKVKTNFFQKLLYWSEAQIIRKAKIVLVANSYRSRIVRFIYSVPKEKVFTLENFNHLRKERDTNFKDQRFNELIDTIHGDNHLAILHQGQVSEGRGLKYLLEFSTKIQGRAKIIFMGISEQRYERLIVEYPHLKMVSAHIGYVPYELINEYWSKVDATLVFYDIKEINNKYCAPNRLYLALSNRIPLMVNLENPVLSEAVIRHDAGMVMTDTLTEKEIEVFLSKTKTKGFYPYQDKEFSFESFSAPILIKVYNEYV